MIIWLSLELLLKKNDQKITLIYNGNTHQIFLSNIKNIYYFCRLAKDFFSKLCAYPPSERYDAKMAL